MKRIAHRYSFSFDGMTCLRASREAVETVTLDDRSAACRFEEWKLSDEEAREFFGDPPGGDTWHVIVTAISERRR